MKYLYPSLFIIIICLLSIIVTKEVITYENKPVEKEEIIEYQTLELLEPSKVDCDNVKINVNINLNLMPEIITGSATH